jgi:hypothetical protein
MSKPIKKRETIEEKIKSYEITRKEDGEKARKKVQEKITAIEGLLKESETMLDSQKIPEDYYNMKKNTVDIMGRLQNENVEAILLEDSMQLSKYCSPGKEALDGLVDEIKLHLNSLSSYESQHSMMQSMHSLLSSIKGKYGDKKKVDSDTMTDPCSIEAKEPHPFYYKYTYTDK